MLAHAVRGRPVAHDRNQQVHLREPTDTRDGGGGGVRKREQCRPRPGREEKRRGPLLLLLIEEVHRTLLLIRRRDVDPLAHSVVQKPGRDGERRASEYGGP